MIVEVWTNPLPFSPRLPQPQTFLGEDFFAIILSKQNASFHFFRPSNSRTPIIDDILRTQGDACSENSNNSNSGCDVDSSADKASESNNEKRRMRSSPDLLHTEGRLKEERGEERRCGRYKDKSEKHLN